MRFPLSIEDFIRSFSQLPGIGRKTAERLAFYLISRPAEFANGIAEAIKSLKANTLLCEECGNITDRDICPVCDDDTRDKSVICVVESAIDIYYIEDTHSFDGIYHVLGALISPLEGITPQDLSLDSLKKRVKKNNAKEIILATSPTTEGDTTGLYIKDMFDGTGLKISNLARGIPVGTDLQYAGNRSLVLAFKHREEI